MVKFDFDSNLKGLSSVLEKATFKAVTERITKTVGSIRCAEHGKSPTIKIIGSDISNLSFDVSGCCKEMIDKVKMKIK